MQETQALGSIIDFSGCTIWQKDHLVLSDVSFSVGRSEFIYLVGKVGSGKTSLIKTINAQLPLRDGEAMVAGFNLRKIRSREIPLLRRRLGIVFQDFQLLTDRNVHDNLEFVLKATGWKIRKEIETRITEVLDKVGLGLKGYKMTHQLSGGEQQRVVIGRALLNDPDIILADEPTGNLDPGLSMEVMGLFRRFNEVGVTVVIATHDIELVKASGLREIIIADGKVQDPAGENLVVPSMEAER